MHSVKTIVYYFTSSSAVHFENSSTVTRARTSGNVLECPVWVTIRWSGSPTVCETLAVENFCRYSNIHYLLMNL